MSLMQLALVCLFGYSSCVLGNDDHDSKKPERYRKLVKQYSQLSSAEKYQQENLALRKQLSLLCREIIKERLPKGTKKSDVIMTLGSPVIDIDDALFYFGDDISYFNVLFFEKGKLTKTQHGYAFDAESGK